MFTVESFLPSTLSSSDSQGPRRLSRKYWFDSGYRLPCKELNPRRNYPPIQSLQSLISAPNYDWFSYAPFQIFDQLDFLHYIRLWYLHARCDQNLMLFPLQCLAHVWWRVWLDSFDATLRHLIWRSVLACYLVELYCTFGCILTLLYRCFEFHLTFFLSKGFKMASLTHTHLALRLVIHQQLLQSTNSL